MQPPVLRAALPLALRLIDVGQRGDDVVRAAQLAERELDAGPSRLLGLEENESMRVRDDHAYALALAPLQRNGEVLEDRTKMNLPDLQRYGDVFQFLALLSGDTAIGQEHQIGCADNLLFGLPAHAAGNGGELGQDVSLGADLSRHGDAACVDEAAGPFLIDVLD